MTVSSSVNPWTLVMPQGSAQEWQFTLTVPGVPGGNTPYNIIGSTWEYAVSDQSYNQLFSVTANATADGRINVTSTAALSQVTLILNPAATQDLAPGTYFHTLWLDPGTSQAIAIAGDRLIIQGTPQP